MAVGKGSLKRMSAAAKSENEREAMQNVTTRTEAAKKVQNEKNENGMMFKKKAERVSKIVCVLPDHLL